MDIIKKLFLAILGLVGLTIGGYVYLDKNKPGTVLGIEGVKEKIEEKLPPKDEVQNKIPFKEISSFEGVESESVQKAADATSEQLKTLTQKASEVKNHLTNIISKSEQDNDTPLHEKAFEYGQYVYCQQVVKEYGEN